jgi:hypothetical protein
MTIKAPPVVIRKMAMGSIFSLRKGRLERRPLGWVSKSISSNVFSHIALVCFSANRLLIKQTN